MARARVSEIYNKKKETLDKEEETTAKKMQREKATRTVEKASQKTQETIVKDLANLKLGITDTLDRISNQLATEIDALKEVQEAIAVEQSNLKNLHDITQEANSLQALVVSQTEAKEEFEEKISQARALWDQETKAFQKTQQELAKETNKQRVWENEQYTYDLARKRKVEEDAYKETHDQQVKAFAAAVQTKSQELDAREVALGAKEAEVAALRENVSKAEEVTKAEAARQVAIATNSLKKDLTHEHALAKLQLENQLNLKLSDINSLTQRINELTKQNTELDAKYKMATDKVQAIAEKAIDGASKQNMVFQVPSQDNSNSNRK